jgi:hypothetical protein
MSLRKRAGYSGAAESENKSVGKQLQYYGIPRRQIGEVTGIRATAPLRCQGFVRGEAAQLATTMLRAYTSSE